MGKILQYAFWLTLILILVVYYRGTTANLGVFGEMANKVLLTLSGRNDKGEFADYPDGKF